MEKVSSNPDLFVKKIILDSEPYTAFIKIQINDNSIDALVFSNDASLYNGNIKKKEIKKQIGAFAKYDIREIFEELNFLEANCFNIVEESGRYMLKIKIKILRKEEYLAINLEENKNTILPFEELVNYYDNIIKEKDDIILELNQIIKKKDELIESLRSQLNKAHIRNIEDTKLENIDSTTNDNLYNDFNIELKNPIHILNYHTDWVYCLTVMNDGRLVSGSRDKSIIIYNKETYKPDLIIKEDNGPVNYITQLNLGILASCSSGNSIKLFNIKGNKYEVFQTLNYHRKSVYKIIELKNKTLASCSYDNSIIFYIKDNLKYKKDYKISTNGHCSKIIQTKDNEICYYEYNNNAICFYDLLERKVKVSISNISPSVMIMMTKDLLLITGYNKISIINVNNYKLRIINVLGADWINGVCMINQNMLLTGDQKGIIRQWRIEDDNLILVSKKEKAHDWDINDLVNLGNGHIASCSSDKTIKIW